MLDNFLKKSWNPILFRIITTLGFLFSLLILYFGSIKILFNFNSELIMTIIWILWWPFLYITLIFLGRFWCGFICPIGLSNEAGNYIRKSKKNYLAGYGFISFIIFFIIVFWEQVSGLFSSPFITFIFLLTFFLTAFIVGIILPRWGFCKYFCPIGTLLGVFSRLSIIGVRTNKNICKTCTTKECLKGGKAKKCPMYNNVPNLQSNKDCLICTNCIKNCPYNSAKLKFVKPSGEINNKIGFNTPESLFIITLLGFSLLLTSTGTQLLRIIETGNPWVRALDFLIAIIFSLVIYFIITYIHSKIAKKHYGESLKEGGYIYLPLTFSIFFLSIVFGFITPLIDANLLAISLSKYVILIIGFTWSIKIAWNFFKKRSIVYIITLTLIFLLWLLIIIPGPLTLTQEDITTYNLTEDKIIEMDSFSMGYNPSKIRAHAGDSFSIKVKNMDITHTFDIDPLNIHENIKGGEIREINITNIEAGEYEYYCNIPGHKEAGMWGILIIEP